MRGRAIAVRSERRPSGASLGRGWTARASAWIVRPVDSRDWLDQGGGESSRRLTWHGRRHARSKRVPAATACDLIAVQRKLRAGRPRGPRRCSAAWSHGGPDRGLGCGRLRSSTRAALQIRARPWFRRRAARRICRSRRRARAGAGRPQRRRRSQLPPDLAASVGLVRSLEVVQRDRRSNVARLVAELPRRLQAKAGLDEQVGSAAVPEPFGAVGDEVGARPADWRGSRRSSRAACPNGGSAPRG